MRRKSAAGAAMVVSVIFTVSAVSGFLREVVLAAYLGTTSQADALQVAMLIPAFFFDLLGEAALGAAVVPVFMSHIAPQEPAERREIIGSAFTILSLVLVPMAAIAVLCAPFFARLFAPGFGSAKLQMTAVLMRVMLPSIVFVGLANLATGLLHALKKFGAASATGIALNLCVIATTIPLAQRYGVVAPALGVLLGGILQLAIQVPPLVRSGLLPAIGFRFRDPALARMWWLFWPILGGAIFVQGSRAIDKIIASFLPTGSIAALNYASKIAGGPARVFAMAVSVAFFPSFAKQVHDKSIDVAQSVKSGLGIAAALTLPWTAIFIALREPIVFVLLQRGAFDAQATALVAFPMAIYGIGEFADGVGTMMNNAFYSYHDSRTPTMVTIATRIFRVIIALTFVRWLGYGALALAAAIGSNLSLSLLIWRLRRNVTELDIKGIVSSLARITLASAVAGVVAWLAFGFIARFTGTLSTLTGALVLVASSVPAIAAFVAAGMALRVEEIPVMVRRTRELIRARLSR